MGKQGTPHLYLRPTPGAYTFDATLAACRDVDAELFFPAGDRELPAGAATVCGRCPIRAECLEYAMGDLTLTGVWGGTSYAERRWGGPSHTPRKRGEADTPRLIACQQCGDPFATRRHNGTYCSDACRMKASRTRKQLPPRCPGCGTTTTGGRCDDPYTCDEARAKRLGDE
jgi:WhiB family redox-sensing transcriptional regulator